MNKYNLIEYKRFIKKYYKKVLLLSFIIALSTSLLTLLISTNTTKLSNEPLEFEEKTENRYITNGPSIESKLTPAFFQLYIVRPDGTPFISYTTMQRFMTTDRAFKKVLDSTGVNIPRILERVNLREQDNYSPVTVSLDEASNILTAMFNVGKNTTNVRIANFYYEYILSNEFELMEDNSIYTLKSPQLVQIQSDSNQGDLEYAETTSTENNHVTKLIFAFIITFIAVVFFALALFVIKEITSRRLSFSFSYMFDASDNFYLYDESLDNQEFVSHAIGYPFSTEKLLLTESSLSSGQLDLLFKQIESEITFTEATKNRMHIDIKDTLTNTSIKNNYSEIIIIVEATITTRKWFENQLRLSESYNIPVKVIQINDY